MKDRILIKRNVLEITGELCGDAAAYAAKLFNQFGIVVDKPKYLSAANLETVAAFYGTEIPEGFYKNPQHTGYFNAGELLVEQLVSYFTVAICGEQSLNEEVFTRKTVFNKALPDYEEGKEVKIRYYRMLSSDECDRMLAEIASDYCRYTRPWALEEKEEFKWMYLNGYYRDEVLKCKDNAIEMYLDCRDRAFALMLDKKDVVKMSVAQFGERGRLALTDYDRAVFSLAVSCARDCPLSKKQAKYFNSLVKNVGLSVAKATNEASAYKQALTKLNAGDVLGAARVFADNGAMLERNVVFLLSRSNEAEARQIADMLKCDNPIVLIQLLYGLDADDERTKRVFSFTHDRRYKTHEETDYEFKYRKSLLKPEIRAVLKSALNDKIGQYYSGQPSLGKIYVSEQFKKVALPLNTSASGMGLDVLPTGSRLPLRGEYLRTFCYWKDAFDIDASVIFLKANGDTNTLYWGNYAKKEFGKSVLCSGDDRSENGAEYCDFKIDEVTKLGYEYAIFCLNGYNSTLDEGEIYCGYQDKANLKTRAWSPKNIEFKIRVKGKTRFYMGFAFDMVKRETVVLNRLQNSFNRVIDEEAVKNVRNLLSRGYLDTFNAYRLLSLRGTLVDKPEDAETVFDADYLPSEGQTVIRPHETEKLVALMK